MEDKQKKKYKVFFNHLVVVLSYLYIHTYVYYFDDVVLCSGPHTKDIHVLEILNYNLDSTTH